MSKVIKGSGFSSPSRQPPLKWKDSDLDYKFVEFPKDVFFLESLAQNDTFNKGVAYVPVQRQITETKVESHLYSFTVDSTEAKHVAGPFLAPDGSPAVTIFGTALSSKGILYMCAFNRNSIIHCDLSELKGGVIEEVMCQEIPHLSSPNDVCLDPDNEADLYVVGGTFRTLCFCLPFSNAAYGQIYKVTNHSDVTLVATDLKTLAGAEVLNGKLWIAQLFDIIIQENADNKTIKQVWQGQDGKGLVWLADNLDVFDVNKIICPAYSTAPAAAVDSVKDRAWLTSTGVFFSQMISGCMHGERLDKALEDPEVCLSFSNTYISSAPPAPIRLIFLTESGDSAWHFEIDLEETRKDHPAYEVYARGAGAKDKNTGQKKVLGQRHFFNEQVTHAGQMKSTVSGDSYIALVNFEQPRIMLMKDEPFREAMATTDIPAVTG